MAGLYVCSMKGIYAKRTQGREEGGKEEKRERWREREAMCLCPFARSQL